MSSLPNPSEVSGKHDAIYEAYYKQLDSKGTGAIQAMDAAKFLKKSGLSDVVLSRIWDLSDPNGRGFLDKSGFFVALKLVALAQQGQDINMRNIYSETKNAPKVGELPKIMPQAIQTVPATNTDWSMKQSDKLRYEQLFHSLQPVNGLIAGNKVKGVLMDSKLPLDTLGKIWDLADQDKDGNLDKHEFTIAMHLVYQALDKRAVPTTLPAELQKEKPKSIPKAPSGEGFGDGGFVANFPKDIVPAPAPVLLPNTVAPNVQMTPRLPLIYKKAEVGASVDQDWVVTPQDKIRYDIIFRDSDKDRDGLVSGYEIKNVFLQSGVPTHCLAHIWALCDTNQSGKLTMDQFALAMWLVEQKKKGNEPPETLAPNMIPPSLRNTPNIMDVSVAQPEPKRKYSNPELEMISKEIDELNKERQILEADHAQKEADVRIKSGEIRSLHSEYDTLAATLKQLENQKREAQKRLDDLITQVSRVREQCQKQEETINEEEGELNQKRSELQKLKDEEAALEKEYESYRQNIENLSKQLQDQQLQISQIKAMVTQLLECHRQMSDAVLICKAALESNDAYLVSDYSLKIEPDFQEAKETLEKTNEPPKPDPFNETSSNFNNKDGFVSNGFSSTKATSDFDESFANATLSGFDDAFSSSFQTDKTKDPFSSNADPFGDKKGTSEVVEAGKDDFGSDPFAILHAPTTGGQVLSPNPTNQKSGPPPRPESPSPALPPKKSKQPPPRPAPPRPLQGPTRPAPPVTDSFGSSMGGFADFADFDNNKPIIFQLPSPLPMPQSSKKSQEKHDTATTTALTSSKNHQNQQYQHYSSEQQTDLIKNPSVVTDKTSNEKSPLDFNDDPFKDYRYEDVFNINDPFDSDDVDFEPRTTKVASEGDSTSNNTLDLLNESRKSFKLKKFSAWEVETKENNGVKVINCFEDDFHELFKKTDNKPITNTQHTNNILDVKNNNNIDKNNSIYCKNGINLKCEYIASEKMDKDGKKDMKLDNTINGRIPEKFINDYSKSDTFADDVETAIQRSLFDK